MAKSPCPFTQVRGSNSRGPLFGRWHIWSTGPASCHREKALQGLVPALVGMGCEGPGLSFGLQSTLKSRRAAVGPARHCLGTSVLVSDRGALWTVWGETRDRTSAVALQLPLWAVRLWAAHHLSIFVSRTGSRIIPSLSYFAAETLFICCVVPFSGGFESGVCCCVRALWQPQNLRPHSEHASPTHYAITRHMSESDPLQPGDKNV